jgi:uncharacterized protein YjbI with pentapeptide repeats
VSPPDNASLNSHQYFDDAPHVKSAISLCPESSLCGVRGGNGAIGNIAGADLLFANLIGANPSEANPSGANLANADWSGADLGHANMGVGSWVLLRSSTTNTADAARWRRAGEVS